MNDIDESVIEALVDSLELHGERATHVLGDGSERVVVELLPDEFAYVEDDQDWIGKVADCGDGWSRHQERPSGFDGGARKVHYDRGYVCWWQPPAEALTDDALLESLQRSLVNILSYGYMAIAMTVERRCQYGDWHPVASSYIGGLEPIVNGVDLHSMVTELSYQIHDSELAA